MTDSIWFLYVIRCDDDSLYTGIARDIDARFSEHLATFHGQPGAKGAKFFRGRKPLEVVYQKKFADRSLASKAEYQTKQLSRKQKLVLISGPTDTDD